jgi:hypothetical protein
VGRLNSQASFGFAKYFLRKLSIADDRFFNQKGKILFAGCISWRYRLPHDNGK